MKKKAYAKINLFLYILNKREDGYHNLFSLMKKINLCDTVEVTITEIPRIDINTNVPQINNESNLACRAATAFLETTGIKTGLTIKINKKIPLGAGLGGGSSDAAATLTLLNQLFNHPLSQDEMISIASGIGSDVPFFVNPHPSAVVEGKGDKIVDIECHLHDKQVLIAVPPININTGYAYSKLRLTSYDNHTKIPSVELLKNCSFEKIKRYCWNDLEKVVLKEFSGVAKLKDFLKSFFPYTIMSGSGSCVFSIVNRNEEGVIKREVEKTLGEWGVFSKTVDFI